MLRHAQPSSAWDPIYRAERNDLVLTRLRWCLGLGLFGIVVWIVELIVGPSAVRALRIDALVAYATVCVGVSVLTTVPALRQHVVRLALAYVVVLTLGLTAYLNRLPGGPEIAPAVLAIILLGTTLLLPWGLGPQVVVAGVTLAGYLHIYFGLPEPRNMSAVPAMLLGSAVAMVGAYLVDAYRARLFEQTWQQEQLVALTRELVGHADLGSVMTRVVERGRQLLAVDAAVLAQRDRERRMHRVEVAAPADERMAWLLGLEVPDELPFVASVLERDALRMPEDDPHSAVVPLLRERGVHRVLYVVMRYGAEVLGILAFVRKDDVPFTASEQLLARGLADQAALALHNAQLVTDLRRASRLKSEFVSTMSHELRTPLNVILGFSEMGRDPQVDTLECLSRIELAGRELLALIEGTLEIGRLEAGRDQLELAPVALPAWWRALGESCARIPCNPGVVLEWAQEAPPVTLVSDARKLTIVLRNLVGNALKFTERGSVQVALIAEGDALVLRVADTGIGICPEDRAVIFDMFRQGDGSDSRRYGGTGLGLYIVHRFVEQLGGTVAVDSTPGAGSVFTVRLPRDVSAVAAAA